MVLDLWVLLIVAIDDDERRKKQEEGRKEQSFVMYQRSEGRSRGFSTANVRQ